MPAPHTITTFALMSFALIVVPGPSVAFVVSRGVAYGRRAALVTVAGNAVGAYVQVLAVAVGLGAVFERSVTAFTTIKLVGAAYLVWIGVQTIRHRRSGLGARTGSGVRPPRSIRSLAVDGFVVGATNPKSMVFFAAILPPFVDGAGAGAGAQMAFLGLVFVAIALVSDSMWGLAAGTARSWLQRAPDVLAGLAVGSGGVMISLGVGVALTRSD